MRTLLSIALVSIALSAAPAIAQSDYPNKPIRIMVGANAGGGTDVIARMLAEKFGESLKQPFVVENRPGASNTIAADLTAQGAGRRLHAAGRDQHRTGDRAAPAQAQLRSAEAAAAGRADRRRAERAGRRRQGRREGREGRWSPRRRRSRACSSTRRRASAARSTSPARRSTMAAGIKTDARAVQGIEPGARRHPRRQRRDDVRHDVLGDAAHQVGQVPAARGDVAAALGRTAERADDRRSRAIRRPR